MKQPVLFFILIFLSGMMRAQQPADEIHRPDCQLSIDTLGKVTICIGDSVNGRIFLQQFKWNRWIIIDSTIINGHLHDTCFTRKIEHTYSRVTYRVKLSDEKGNYVMMDTVIVNYDANDSCSGFVNSFSKDKKIHFKCVQEWEIYDQYGNMIRKGKSMAIDLKGFNEGNYFLLYADKTEEFFIVH